MLTPKHEKEMSLSWANPHPENTTANQKIAVALIGLSLIALVIALFGGASVSPLAFLTTFLVSLSAGSILFTVEQYRNTTPGIKNNGVMFNNVNSRGLIAWLMGITFTGFYVVLYFRDDLLTGIITMFDPLSMATRGVAADKWFTYGAFYTIAVLLMGIKYIYKYRHNQYQIIRTISVTFFQLGFAFLIPAFLASVNQPEYYFHYFWPLSPYAGEPNNVMYLTGTFGKIGLIFILISTAMLVIVTPIMTYFYGKRWYCSWVCGCGGLAETAGDPFRHLSDKSLKAWKAERYIIHGVLVVIILITAMLWIDHYTGFFGGFSQVAFKYYYFAISSMFAGVVGTGFYPLLGNRIWCRFGCPMAAILGLIQRFKSRFRITTNGDQCISCGNCSTYCEQGIDVRWYAQRGQNIVRASCVGCGVCAAVCPRGVLRLENGPDDNETRLGVQAIHISRDEVKVLS